MRVAVFVCLLVPCAVALACKVDPLYCDSSHRCTDPARPYGDLNGEYPASDGVPRTCIPDPTGDGGAGTEASFNVAVAPGRLFLRQGKSAEAEVTVTRDDGFSETITVTLGGLPGGVLADPVTLDPDETSAILTIAADDGSVQGALDVEVAGTAADLTRTAPLRLVVAGPPGTLDRSFAARGRFAHRVGAGDTVGGRVMILSDGKLVVAGYVFSSVDQFQQAVALRLNVDGTIDDAFGSAGVASPGVGQASTHDMITSSGDGRILAGGSLKQDDTTRLAVFAYTPEGDVDNDFGGTGSRTMEAVGSVFGIAEVLELADGDLLTVGVTGDKNGSPVLQVARFRGDGESDPSFDVSEPLLRPATAILDRDERLVVAGRKSSSEFPSFVARYQQDASLDSSFGEGGVVEANLSPDLEGVTGLVEVEGGKLVATGFLRTPAGAVLTVARYNTEGVLDLTFGNGGTLITDTPIDASALGAVVDDAGRVIVAGHSSISGSPELPAVARILSDGTVDPTFGVSGMATVDFGVDGDTSARANGVAIDADGRIVISGTVGEPGNITLAVARLWP